MNVEQHPQFVAWITGYTGDLDLFGELVALMSALETLGTAIFTGHDECHPVVTSPYLHALRRTPPTETTPYATRPPVIRMLFAVVTTPDNTPSAVMLVGGDKTTLGNLWYPPHVAQAHQRLREHMIRTNTIALRARSQR